MQNKTKHTTLANAMQVKHDEANDEHHNWLRAAASRAKGGYVRHNQLPQCKVTCLNATRVQGNLSKESAGFV